MAINEKHSLPGEDGASWLKRQKAKLETTCEYYIILVIIWLGCIESIPLWVRQPYHLRLNCKSYLKYIIGLAIVKSTSTFTSF